MRVIPSLEEIIFFSRPSVSSLGANLEYCAVVAGLVSAENEVSVAPTCKAVIAAPPKPGRIGLMLLAIAGIILGLDWK